MIEHKGTRTLYTQRLKLRRFSVSDADAIFANWASDPLVAKYVTWDAHPDTAVTQAVLSVWVEQYERATCYHWGIELDGLLIGGISVVDASEASGYAEIGYCIGHAWWGRGIVTEALARVMQYLFEDVGLHRIYLRHDVQNAASGRVMQKCGLTYEGTLREHHRRKDGTYADIALYGILRREWFERKG